MSSERELLERVYDRFNARDIDRILALMHRDIMWANGMEGGHVHGQEGRHRDGLQRRGCLPPALRRCRLHDGVRHPAALRDARLGPIGGGTSEVMNEIIAKQLGL